MLDEPTNGLDPAGMADMRALVVDLARGGQTVLLSSHLLAEVQEICDRVGVINNGRLLRESTVAELRGGSSLRVRGHSRARGARGRDAAGRRRRRTTHAGRPGARPRPPTPPRTLIRELVAAGVDVHEVTPAERSLEEVFFEMTSTDPMSREGACVMSTITAPADIGRATRAEMLRLRKWPAVWITLGTWLALSLMFGYLFNYLSYTTGDSSFSNEGATKATLLAEMMPANAPERVPPGHADVRRRADAGAGRDRRRQRLRLGHLEDRLLPGCRAARARSSARWPR